MLNWRDPRNPQSGGAERVTRAYLANLVERGHEVYWFANDFKGGSPEETIDGIKIVRGGGKGTSILKVIQWYRRQSPFNLVIDQHHGIPWYAPWWSSTNCVAYIHEVLGPIWNAFYPWPVSAIGQFQERWTHRFYRHIPFWTPSDSTKKTLHRHGVAEVKVIPNGTDTQPLTELESKQIGTPLRLAAVSRLAPNKRVDHALQAVKLLLAEGIDCRLSVVGTGDSEIQLKQLAADLGISNKVTFTGQLSESNKNQELRRAHLLVHTSIREGWGLNVIEANAMGTPAAVYPVAGLVDSTIHNQTGIVTSQETPQSLKQSIIDLIKAPENYNRLRFKAWERSKTFQWNKVLPLASTWLEEQANKPKK
jgi:glycosyltransferase involved in cell wall biosynthesis